MNMSGLDVYANVKSGYPLVVYFTHPRLKMPTYMPICKIDGTICKTKKSLLVECQKMLNVSKKFEMRPHLPILMLDLIDLIFYIAFLTYSPHLVRYLKWFWKKLSTLETSIRDYERTARGNKGADHNFNISILNILLSILGEVQIIRW